MTKQELIKTLQTLDCPDDTTIELWNSGYYGDSFTSLNDVELVRYEDDSIVIQLSY